MKKFVRRWLRFMVPARYRLWAKFQRQALKIWWMSTNHQIQIKPPLVKPPRLDGLNILMIYPEIGAPTRYRVTNQAAQMELLGLRPTLRQVDDLAAIHTLAKANLLYLYRVESTPLVRKLVEIARRQRVPIIFDTDDLIWDQRLETYGYLRKHWPAQEVDDFLASVKRYEMIMAQVDYFVVSTPFLARLAETQFGKKAYVNKNTLSQEVQALAVPFYQARAAYDASAPPSRVTIAYFSGTLKAHEEDFRLIVEPLRQILQERPQVIFKVVGYLDLDNLFTGYEDRVQTQSFVEWRRIPEVLSQVDINLAPIVNNPQRRSKSAVKFLEAALLGVPTVASSLEPYQDIQHGQTGFLATTPAEWYDYLLQLIDSPDLRREIGMAARHQVLTQDSVQVRTGQFKQVISQIIEDYYGQ